MRRILLVDGLIAFTGSNITESVQMEQALEQWLR